MSQDALPAKVPFLLCSSSVLQSWLHERATWVEALERDIPNAITCGVAVPSSTDCSPSGSALPQLRAQRALPR